MSKTESEYSSEDARSLPPSLDQTMPVQLRHQVAFELEHCPILNQPLDRFSSTQRKSQFINSPSLPRLIEREGLKGLRWSLERFVLTYVLFVLSFLTWKSNSARMQELLPVTRGQLVYPSYLAGGGDPEMAAPRFLIIVKITNNPDERKTLTSS